VSVDDYIYYTPHLCVVAIIRILQYTFHEFCAILLPRLVLEETASSISLVITD